MDLFVISGSCQFSIDIQKENVEKRPWEAKH